MFQPNKNPADSDSLSFASNTALPNNFGQIRTLREDLENLKAGKTESPAGGAMAEPAVPEPMLPPQPQAQSGGQGDMSPQQVRVQFSPMSQSVAAGNNRDAAAGSSAPQKPSLPNPFGSEEFFHAQSPFSEETTPAKTEPENLSTPKKSGKLILILSLVLLLAIFGGGFYYWWFFMKGQTAATPASNNAVVSQDNVTAGNETPTEPATGQALKRWELDPGADKTATSLAIERYAQNFASATSSDNLIEAKVVSKDNQPIQLQKFMELFSFQLPQPLVSGATDEYSLFVTKQNNEPRMGAAIKLSNSSVDSQSIQTYEPTLASNLSPFYFGKVAVESAGLFNSSKYRNADIRYSNFSGSQDYSLDYSIVSDKSSKYFVFSTSKDSLRAILDYMSEK